LAPLSIQSALVYGTNALSNISDSAKLDSEVLLLHVIQQSRSYLFTWPEKLLSSEQQAEFISLVKARETGQPVAHLIGVREFWSLPLKVAPSTLIPRPDTETLVEAALDKAFSETGTMLDLGTGTGAIALAFASERVNWQVDAVDRVLEAVELARTNQATLGLTNCHIYQSNWFDSVSGEFDIIVSNPPYIAPSDPHLQQGDVRFEPLSALIADKAGMADIELIIQKARKHLKVGGWLLLEHGYDQAQLVGDFFAQMAYKEIATIKDLGANDRVTLAQWQG
jgi:release factor glutamine methyltransferase